MKVAYRNTNTPESSMTTRLRVGVSAMLAALAVSQTLPATAAAQSDHQVGSSWNLLSSSTIFEPPIANVRSPEFSASTAMGDGFRRITGVFGARLPLVTYYRGSATTIQVALDGGVWSQITRTGFARFPLRSTDYLIGLPLMFQVGLHTIEFCVAHISAHLGDGDRSGRSAEIFSREFVTARYGHPLPIGGPGSRSYVSASYLVHTIPSEIGRKSGGVGAELWERGSIYGARWYVAADAAYSEDTRNLDVSGQVGFALGTEPNDKASVRLAVSGFSGRDRRGQFLGEPVKQVSAGVHIRYH